MTLIPYMAGFIFGAIGWAVGRKFGGTGGAILVSLIASTLGFYYTRRYMKQLKDAMGL